VSTSKFPRSFLPDELDLGDWATVQPFVEKLLAREVGAAEDLEQWLFDSSELQAAVSEERSRRYIAMTCNTEDQEAEQAYLHLVKKFMPAAKPWFHRLNLFYLGCAPRAQLDAERYGVLDRDVAMEMELYREANIELQTQASVLSQKYQKINGAMTVQFRGKELTMPQLGKHLEVTDCAERQEAWEASSARRLQERAAFDEIFDELSALRGKIARNADCADYREYIFKSYRRFDYTPADCVAFHAAVEQHVMPLANDLAERRREALGLCSLRPWDYGVDPLGREPLRPFEGAEELGAGCRRIFARIDPELEAQFVGMLKGSELDLESRKGKAPGGYQSTLDEQRRPFIFMNAAGLHRDVETLLHEAGHAFHAIAARQDPLVEYRHAPIEFAEVASMTMELFSDDHLDEFYSKDDAARAKRKHLEGIIGLLPWIARVDAFQHWIYTHPGHSGDERTAAWLALAERFEIPTDWDGYPEQQESSWQRQLHIFCYPFYYIEYGIAQLGALQIWNTYKQDPERALRNYRAALALGGSKPLPQLFEAAGAKLAFDADTITSLMDRIGEELAALPA
jgi:oligoendopeptidase F